MSREGQSYRRWVNNWKRQFSFRGKEPAMYKAVGGDFDAMGIIERELMVYFGLKPAEYIIDVGCGSGRLAKALVDYSSGKYLGIDIVPELVHFARDLVQRSGWRFEVADASHIPEEDRQADWVCFFSVLTHLLQEDSYICLQEAKRVLKPGGKIVLSFLEFRIPTHWTVFADAVATRKTDRPLTVFLDRDAIQAWATHLDLNVEVIRDGNDAFVPLPRPLTLEAGIVMEKFGYLGQSICMLSVPTTSSAESPC